MGDPENHRDDGLGCPRASQIPGWDTRLSGKTRLLECLQHLTHACTGISITPTASTIYRSLEASPETTLLIDELDAVFRDRSDRH